jgi:hypothetical protein
MLEDTARLVRHGWSAAVELTILTISHYIDFNTAGPLSLGTCGSAFFLRSFCMRILYTKAHAISASDDQSRNELGNAAQGAPRHLPDRTGRHGFPHGVSDRLGGVDALELRAIKTS